MQIDTHGSFHKRRLHKTFLLASGTSCHGGFAMVTGDPGTGKSITLRHLHAHLSETTELNVRVIARPQSGICAFYHEIAELADVPVKQNNRFGSFANFRSHWKSHIKSTMFRPVLLIDEAQEA
jgi:general secretion pathway protein A